MLKNHGKHSSWRQKKISKSNAIDSSAGSAEENQVSDKTYKQFTKHKVFMKRQSMNR